VNRSRAACLPLIAAAALLAASAPLPAPAPAAASLPAEFLPAGAPLQEEIEALAARGLLDSLAIHTLPLARVDVAMALDRARRLHPGVEENLHFRRLEREFARELTDLGAPCAARETGPLIDTGSREARLRLQLAGHALGTYDEQRDGEKFRLEKESYLSARAGLHVGSAFAAWDELGITGMTGQRAYIDEIWAGTDVEWAALRAGLTARTGPVTAGVGYDAFRWGPGRRGTLALSDAAGPMTFLSLQGSFGRRVTATAITGALSPADDDWLAAHRLEIAATRSLTLGLTETARYRNPGIDLLYACGLIPYSFVEKIRIREASDDSLRAQARSNVMVSGDVVWRPWPALSLHGELLVDDFATESDDMPDRIAWQAGVRSEVPHGRRHVRLLGEYTRVRNYTYSVDYGLDYAHRGLPTGYALGPDVENLWLELVYDLSRDWQLRWTGDFTNKGEGELGEAWTPDMGPVSNAGLSGVVEERREVWGDVRWLPRDNVDIAAGLGYRHVRNEEHVEGAERSAWLARLALDLRY
jgi:hypothetical protein